ncbi:class II aldolase, partial [Thioclava sp. BHET1]
RTFGTPELAEVVAETLKDRFHACLMANHGTISLGGNLAQAFARTELIETLSQQYLLALSAGQPLVLLSDAEMAEVRATAQKLGYGAPRGANGASS